MTLFDIFFPKRCFSCHRPGSYLCSSCRKNITALDYLICPVCKKPAVDGITHPRCITRYAPDGLVSFFRYKSPIREYIHAIKYRYVFSATDELVDMCCGEQQINILRAIVEQNREQVVLVPIPLHKKRLMERGFNQSECLARCFSQKLHIPVLHDVLVRTRYTSPQALLPHPVERLNNIQDAFDVHEAIKQEGAGKIVFLVDDVWTTGATMTTAARILKHNGVKKVFGVTIAQS